MVPERENFVRLAEKRTSRILEDIRLIGNLSNRHSYEFGDSDVVSIFDAIEKQLTVARSRFDISASSRRKKFSIN